MFTGLIEETGSIESKKQNSEGVEFEIHSSFAADTSVDQSISINGVCLTVTGQSPDRFTVHCVRETLRKTTLGTLQEGDAVNLERALSLQDGIEGHLVQGHVDHLGTITDISKQDRDRLFEIEFPPEAANLVVARGSIAVDGISLTIARMVGKNRFLVSIIPYTYEHTNLNGKQKGDTVNLEYDIIGKYVVRYLEARQDNGESPVRRPQPEAITKAWLRKRGY